MRGCAYDVMQTNWRLGNKKANYMQQMVLHCKLIVRSTCFGYHYAHHQELESIIQVVAACGTWCFGLQVVGLVWSCRLCVHLYNTLELLMMGMMVPEICWANNKFCNKEPSVASSWPFYFQVSDIFSKVKINHDRIHSWATKMPLCSSLYYKNIQYQTPASASSNTSHILSGPEWYFCLCKAVTDFEWK